MSGKVWTDYLTDTAVAIRIDNDILPELPLDSWLWGTLGEVNQQKFRAQRAALFF